MSESNSSMCSNGMKTNNFGVVMGKKWRCPTWFTTDPFSWFCSQNKNPNKVDSVSNKDYQINIYELICACPWVCNVQMFLETAYSSQTKLIGPSLDISEHGIGYLNLAFAANKGQKRPMFNFKSLKRQEGLEIQS